MTAKLSRQSLVGLQADGPSRAADSPPVVAATEQMVLLVPVEAIAPNPQQPRAAIDAADLQGLAESIAANGVLQPIVVRVVAAATPGGPTYELVAGERRWRAAQLAGLQTIRAIVHPTANDADSAQLALAENMARTNLNPVDAARGCALLRDSYGLSVAEIARRTGRSRTAISHLLSLLALPDAVQALISNASLSEGHGRVLRQVEDFQEQTRIAKTCAAEGWSVRDLERYVKQPAAAAAQRAVVPADQEAHLRGASERLERVFGASVLKLRPAAGGSYLLQVRFIDLDTLDSLVEALSPG